MKCLIVVLMLAMVGCTSKVYPNCPTIVLPDDPRVPVKDLTLESTPDEVIKAWVATAYAYRDWNRVVRRQIENINQ